jgi:hypothetical protein
VRNIPKTKDNTAIVPAKPRYDRSLLW